MGGWADGRFGAGCLSALLLLPSADPATRLSAQTLDTIVVRNGNVFETRADGPGLLARLANALHIRTQGAVIRRSLLVNPGDVFDSAHVAESERALRGLGVFRKVELDTIRLRDRLALRVTTADGWSTKPQAGFSSAGGDQTWEIGLVEQNFLGSATELAASYRETPDRQLVELQYQSPHFLARRATLLLRFADLSDGARGAWRFGVPFYETAARRALETHGEAATERVLVFRDGALDQSPERRMLRVGLRGGVALNATSRDYTRAWISAQWRREDYAPDTTTLFPRSVTAEVGGGIEIRHVRFRVMEHFNSYARREDVDLSQVLRMGVWAGPVLGVEFRGQASAVWRGGFVVLRAEGHLADSGRVRAGVTTVSQNLRGQTFVLHGEGGVARRPRPGGEFDLWLDQRGPRLFGAHHFTGTRYWWVAVEHRVLVRHELWGLVGVGVAPFFDWGGAWYADEAARLGGNAGIALRLGPTRSVTGEAAEFAFGWRFGAGVGAGDHWALGIRKGFRF
jgi:hypothetical protein